MLLSKITIFSNINAPQFYSFKHKTPVGFAGLRSLNLKDLFISHGASIAYGMELNITLPIFEGGRTALSLHQKFSAFREL